jgi:hypothetical protein
VLRFYDELVADLAACQQLALPEGERIEAAFKVSMYYRARVKRWLISYEFSDPYSEIRFFKEGKPLFTSKIEFYTHCYRALLFLPRGNSRAKIHYWRRELARIDGFYALQADFIETTVPEPPTRTASISSGQITMAANWTSPSPMISMSKWRPPTTG